MLHAPVFDCTPALYVACTELTYIAACACVFDCTPALYGACTGQLPTPEDAAAALAEQQLVSIPPQVRLLPSVVSIPSFDLVGVTMS